MNRTFIAISLAFLGTLFILAMQFNLLGRDLAMFAAISLYMASGLAWWLPWGGSRGPKE